MYISDDDAVSAMAIRFSYLDFHKIPSYMLGGIGRYLVWGIRPGGFLEAVFTNDFKLAVTRADAENSTRLREYAFLLFQLPGNVAGSFEVYERWISQGGLAGRCRRCGFPGQRGHADDCPEGRD